MPTLSQRAKAFSLSKEKKRKLKAIDAALEAQDSSLIERILGRIVLPTPEKAKDGENAPQMSEILEAITPLLPKTKVEQTTVVEKIDPQDMEEFIKGLLPKEDLTLRPAVEQITVDVSDDKLEEFVSKEEMKEHLRKIQDAITGSQSNGGGSTPDVTPLANIVEANEATNVITVAMLDTTKLNIIHATEAGSTVQLPIASPNYIVWVEDAVVGGGNITITRET